MALEDLQEDLRSNVAAAQKLLSGDPENPLIKHLVNSLWPFQEAVLEEMSEQAEALDELVDQTGDMIQAETAAVFAAVILVAQKLADELDRKLGPSELELRGLIVKARAAANEAAALLQDITIPSHPDDPDDDDDDGDDDDDDDDETETTDPKGGV